MPTPTKFQNPTTEVEGVRLNHRLSNFQNFPNFIKLTIHFQDGSGTITTKELLPILRSIGQNPTEDEILNLVIEYDVNGDGTIDFDEFLEMMQKVSKGKQPNQKT